MFAQSFIEYLTLKRQKIVTSWLCHFLGSTTTGSVPAESAQSGDGSVCVASSGGGRGRTTVATVLRIATTGNAKCSQCTEYTSVAAQRLEPVVATLSTPSLVPTDNRSTESNGTTQLSSECIAKQNQYKLAVLYQQ